MSLDTSSDEGCSELPGLYFKVLVQYISGSSMVALRINECCGLAKTLN